MLDCPWGYRTDETCAAMNPLLYDFELLDRHGLGEYGWDRCAGNEETFGSVWRWRDELCELYAFAVPEWGAVSALVQVSPLVEIGAGNGYWAKIISDCGGDVLAFDLCPPGYYGSWFPDGRMWFPVATGDATAAGLYPERTLFLCWPPYDNPMAYNALRAHAEAGGTRVAYIGEGGGGCTADEGFHAMLASEFREVAHMSLPQMYGLHDRLTIHEREALDA